MADVWARAKVTHVMKTLYMGFCNTNNRNFEIVLVTRKNCRQGHAARPFSYLFIIGLARQSSATGNSQLHCATLIHTEWLHLNSQQAFHSEIPKSWNKIAILQSPDPTQ